jgi:ABC-type transport system involved in cytochrome bd biosynthesis fused ATPase/permease subunit
MMRNILQWCEGRSLLLVTHRVHGLEQMDQILLLQESGISESGSHLDLVTTRETN